MDLKEENSLVLTPTPNTNLRAVSPVKPRPSRRLGNQLQQETESVSKFRFAGGAKVLSSVTLLSPSVINIIDLDQRGVLKE